jgi:hypothetical protein
MSEEIKPVNEYFQLHLLLMKVEDFADGSHRADILEEEELAGHRPNFPPEQEQTARAIFSALTGINVMGQMQFKIVPAATPLYQELLDWIKEKGKTEQDLFQWWAEMDIEAYKDMNTKEWIEQLTSEGIPVYNRDHVMPMWEEVDEDTRANYKEFMVEYFGSQPRPTEI